MPSTIKRLTAFDFDLTLFNFGDIEIPSPSDMYSYFGSCGGQCSGLQQFLGRRKPRPSIT